MDFSTCLAVRFPNFKGFKICVLFSYFFYLYNQFNLLTYNLFSCGASIGDGNEHTKHQKPHRIHFELILKKLIYM